MSRIAFALAVLASLGAMLSLSPAPTWPLWVAHLVALEASLVVTLLGLLALLLASRGARARDRAAVVARRLALAAAIAGLVPFAAAARLYTSAGVRFSILAYVGSFQEPLVPFAKDVDLDVPSLRADL